jgi:hypothetical protein
MAVIQKTLFAKNLDKYAVLVNDTEPNSRYFKITELPDTFTGGKNAFLVAGSKELVADTKIQIELKDSIGNIIYHEPGEGYISSSLNGTPFVTEYYEGVSKVVSVYVYPDTSYGPCTLTILGELSEYTDANGIVTPVGLDWENKYNVKWTKTINVNPALANTTKIRFYQRPVATISEILSPIYKIENDLKVASAVTQSFANIKLSKLETFAGDVKRVKVFRTSQGDISDYDLIQDILVESKELLTSYGLSGSVVGETGILTSETLKNNWNTGSLNAFLTSSRVESGVRLTGSGYFTYTSSLDIKSANTYELNLDAFYSASVPTNLGIYLVSGSVSSSIATLNGTTPTKNLLDTVIPFKIDTDYPSASLYFSQSQGEWHVGNISLKLSQDTAFSPDEISFVTTMPTVLGNETFNFKFEFYDVNNNYVPVAVTQSATFNGGNTNIGGTILLISSSTSQSLADLNRVSSSISGTVTNNSSSVSGSLSVVSGSIVTLSGSVSASITSLSSSVSSSNVFILSSSLSKTQELANGQFSGSFIGSDVIYSPTIGGQQGYISSLFKVGTAPSIYLDARQNPRKIFIGGVIPSGQTEYSGAFNNTNTNVYLDSSGKFSLGNKLSYDGTNLSVNGSITITNPSTANNGGAVGSFSNGDALTGGSIAGVTIASTKIYIGTGTFGNANTSFYVDNTGQFSLKDKLTWNGTTLSITGNINISGGDAATKISDAALSGSNAQGTANSAASAASTAQGTANSAVSAAATAQSAADTAASKIFTDAAGKIIKAAAPTGKGLFLDSTNLGFYNTTDYPSSPWRTYMDSSGNFQLVGASSNGLTWNASTSVLSIDGNITARNGTFIGNITSTATITGGTITGGAINGSTFTGATGTFSGTITASGGTIGSWTIDSGNLRTSNSRMILNPTAPSITLNDVNGNAKTTIRTGALGVISSTSFVVSNFTILSPSVTHTGTSTSSGKTYTEAASSLSSLPAGLYNASYSYNYISIGNVVQVDAFTSGQAFYSQGVDIVDGSGNVISSYTFGSVSRTNFSGNSSANAGTLSSDTGFISVTLPTTDTYYARPWYSYTVNASGAGFSKIFARSYSTPTLTFTKVSGFAELTDEGLQIVSSTSRFIKMQTGGTYDLESKGTWEHDAGDVSLCTTSGNAYVRNSRIATQDGTYPSDERLKEDISNLNEGLEVIKKINPKWFRFKNRKNEKFNVGVIAQDVEPYMPEFIVDDSDGYLNVNYNAIYMSMINAIKELAEKVEKLEAQISGSI